MGNLYLNGDGSVATKGWPALKTRRWTYGAELELADWDQRRPHRWRTDMDWTMVNSNGIAVDPRGQVYHLGGEVLTEPTASVDGVANQLVEFVRIYPETSVNYRSNLHVHIRVPGLRDDLDRLKRLQSFCSLWLAQLFPLIEPIPTPKRSSYLDEDEWKGARKRYARRKVSHQKIMSPATVSAQLEAKTCREFFEIEALDPETGKLFWATKPRCAVNLRQLLTTDTIEFRHFPGTLLPHALITAVEWCRDFLDLAFDNSNPVRHFKTNYANRTWPTFEPYIHWMELGFLRTNPHYVGKEAARAAIERMLACGSSSSVMATDLGRRMRLG